MVDGGWWMVDDGCVDVWMCGCVDVCTVSLIPLMALCNSRHIICTEASSLPISVSDQKQSRRGSSV